MFCIFWFFKKTAYNGAISSLPLVGLATDGYQFIFMGLHQKKFLIHPEIYRAEKWTDLEQILEIFAALLQRSIEEDKKQAPVTLTMPGFVPLSIPTWQAASPLVDESHKTPSLVFIPATTRICKKSVKEADANLLPSSQFLTSCTIVENKCTIPKPRFQLGIRGNWVIPIYTPILWETISDAIINWSGFTGCRAFSDAGKNRIDIYCTKMYACVVECAIQKIIVSLDLVSETTPVAIKFYIKGIEYTAWCQ